MTESHEAATRILNDYHDRLERAAGEGPPQFAEAFRNGPVGVGVHEIDNKMRVVRISPETPARLREKAVVGRPIWEMIVMQEAAQRAIEQSSGREGAARPLSRSFRRADGTAIALMLVDRLLRDPKGAIVGIRTAMTEVSA